MSIAPEALGLPTGVPALGSELGEADAAPPIITLVYQYARLGALRPYAGGGLGLMFTYNARATNPVLTEVGESTFSIDPAAGLVLRPEETCGCGAASSRVPTQVHRVHEAHATVENIGAHTRAPHPRGSRRRDRVDDMSYADRADRDRRRLQAVIMIAGSTDHSGRRDLGVARLRRARAGVAYHVGRERRANRARCEHITRSGASYRSRSPSYSLAIAWRGTLPRHRSVEVATADCGAVVDSP